MHTDEVVRNQMKKMIRQGNAFAPLSEVLESVPYEKTGEKIPGSNHTIWEVTEHIRLCLYDLVEYSKDSYFKSPPWPEGYWPGRTAPSSEKEWMETVERISQLTEEMIELIQDPDNDLYQPFSSNPEHNLLRQAIIVAEHNAYHGGQLAMMKKVLVEH